MKTLSKLLAWDELIKDQSRTLVRLIKENNEKTNNRAKLATVKSVKYKKLVPNIFTYLVKGNMKSSSKSGYIVNVLIDKDHLRKNAQLTRQPLRLSCTCPAFLYWGSKYHATKEGYNLGKGERRKPKKRDPEGKNKICKHIVAVKDILKNEKIKASNIQETAWNSVEVLSSLENVEWAIVESERDFAKLMYNLVK